MPVLDYREGDPDWGGEEWKQPTDPTRWLKYSVVWYSQRITHALGAERLTAYANAFSYGNADFSGDPGKNNGLERAWIISSLKIAPAEQIAFLDKLVNRRLPVAPHVFDEIEQVVEAMPPMEGWVAHGKTGTAFPRKADGSFDKERGYGWYVGWAVKGERKLLFARLIQDEGAEPSTPGVRARDAFIKELSSLADPARQAALIKIPTGTWPNCASASPGWLPHVSRLRFEQISGSAGQGCGDPRSRWPPTFVRHIGGGIRSARVVPASVYAYSQRAQ